MKKRCLFASKGRARGGLGVPVVGAAIGAGDVGGLERLGQVLMDDLEGIGIGVVDADLLRRETMLDDLVFDPFEGE